MKVLSIATRNMTRKTDPNRRVILKVDFWGSEATVALLSSLEDFTAFSRGISLPLGLFWSAGSPVAAPMLLGVSGSDMVVVRGGEPRADELIESETLVGVYYDYSFAEKGVMKGVEMAKYEVIANLKRQIP